MTDLNTWRDEGRHLPEFMRDLHDQKLVFKWLDRAAQAQNQASRDKGYSALYDHPDFRSAMTYTVDIFLWILAAHGYTLQPTRQKVEGLGDLREALARFDQFLAARQREAIEAMRAERRLSPLPDPAPEPQ